jgi:hypothetical protein
MKSGNGLLITAAILALVPAMGAFGQYKPTGDDGITASPRLRQQLDERKAAPAAAVAPTVVVKPASSDVPIAASPRLQQAMAERGSTTVTPAVAVVTSTTARPNDGIAASPKLREQLNERAPAFQVAPIK